MKRTLLLIIVLSFFTASTVWAQFCSKCGAKALFKATHCTQCGAAVTEKLPLPIPEKPVPVYTPPTPIEPAEPSPPPRSWEKTTQDQAPEAVPQPSRRARPARIIPRRSLAEIREAYGSLNFWNISSWRFDDNDEKSNFGLFWQHLGLESFLANPEKLNHLWGELGVHYWNDQGSFPNDYDASLVNINVGVCHFWGNQSTERKVRTGYALLGVGYYSATTEFYNRDITIDEGDWGHCWGLGYIFDRFKVEWRRHWAEVNKNVFFDGHQFSIGYRF